MINGKYANNQLECRQHCRQALTQRCFFHCSKTVTYPLQVQAYNFLIHNNMTNMLLLLLLVVLPLLAFTIYSLKLIFSNRKALPLKSTSLFGYNLFTIVQMITLLFTLVMVHPNIVSSNEQVCDTIGTSESDIITTTLVWNSQVIMTVAFLNAGCFMLCKIFQKILSNSCLSGSKQKKLNQQASIQDATSVNNSAILYYQQESASKPGLLKNFVKYVVPGMFFIIQLASMAALAWASSIMGTEEFLSSIVLESVRSIALTTVLLVMFSSIAVHMVELVANFGKEENIEQEQEENEQEHSWSFSRSMASEMCIEAVMLSITMISLLLLTFAASIGSVNLLGSTCLIVQKMIITLYCMCSVANVCITPTMAVEKMDLEETPVAEEQILSV